jgi:hypothetical protein
MQIKYNILDKMKVVKTLLIIGVFLALSASKIYAQSCTLLYSQVESGWGCDGQCWCINNDYCEQLIPDLSTMSGGGDSPFTCVNTRNHYSCAGYLTSSEAQSDFCSGNVDCCTDAQQPPTIEYAESSDPNAPLKQSVELVGYFQPNNYCSGYTGTAAISKLNIGSTVLDVTILDANDGSIWAAYNLGRWSYTWQPSAPGTYDVFFYCDDNRSGTYDCESNHLTITIDCPAGTVPIGSSCAEPSPTPTPTPSCDNVAPLAASLSSSIVGDFAQFNWGWVGDYSCANCTTSDQCAINGCEGPVNYCSGSTITGSYWGPGCGSTCSSLPFYYQIHDVTTDTWPSSGNTADTSRNVDCSIRPGNQLDISVKTYDARGNNNNWSTDSIICPTLTPTPTPTPYHRTCISGSCTMVAGSGEGVILCGSDFECITPTPTSTIVCGEMVCTPQSLSCDFDTCTEQMYWYETCEDSCGNTEDGSNWCADDASCVPTAIPTPTPYHRQCIGSSCTMMPGSGDGLDNLCSADLDCVTTATPSVTPVSSATPTNTITPTPTCFCDDWAYQGCGDSPCDAVDQRRTRSCSPIDCGEPASPNCEFQVACVPTSTPSNNPTPTPYCGDGDVNVAGEECDDGNGSNFDDCLNECLWTSCGDGVQQTPNYYQTGGPLNDGVEECDWGSSCDMTGNGCILINDPWWQTYGGLVYGQDSIESPIPASLEISESLKYLIKKDKDETEDSAGVPITTDSQISVGDGDYSDRTGQPVVNTAQHNQVVRQDFDYFARFYNLEDNVIEVDTVTDFDILAQPTVDEVYIYNFDSDITVDLLDTWSPGGQHIIFVTGDIIFMDSAGLESLVLLSQGDFVAFIASGTITFDSSVGYDDQNTDPSTASPNLAGFYVADYIVLDSDGGTEKKFIGEGSFIGWDGFSLNRDFGSSSNASYPTEVFIYRPDLILSTPDRILQPINVWQEVL